jgi:hypothetical protein
MRIGSRPSMLETGHLRAYVKGFSMTKKAALWLAVFLICVPAGMAQKKESPTRGVSGTVTTPDNKAAVGAWVQLTDTKTKQVRSFFAEKGDYYFHGLSTDIDYELKATYQGATSGTKTLSSFDTRKEAVINLKVKPKD